MNIEQYLHLIKSIANKYKTFGVPLDDLIQEGMIGLLEAEKNFDESKNAKFSTYATYWIKKKIIKAIEQEKKGSLDSIEFTEIAVPEQIQTEQSLKKKIELPDNIPDNEKTVLELLFNEEKTLNEIAEFLGISRERVRQLKEKGLRRLRAEK